MLSLGVISIALYAVQVISFPLTNPMNEDDTKKVMRCIVEVISDTLSKPSPIPISQECLETLRGDERIISILRHQNLLKELQELAAQGATERSQKPKKSTGFEDELSEVLEKQNMKSIRSGKSEEIPAEDHERSFNGKSAESANRQPEEAGKTSSEQEFPENSREDDNGEELESNDISKREETSRDEEIDNRITDEINKLPTEPEVSEDTSESQSSEEKEVSNINEKNIEASKADDSDNDKLNETDDEEDDTQQEDNSMKLSEDQDEDKQEHMQEDETSKNDEDKEKLEAGNSHQSLPKSEEETSSKELEDSKRWNKMDELAKQLTSKKSLEENSSEEDPDQSMKNPLKDNYEATNHGSVERQPWQTSTEDSAPQIAKRPEPEERKEEEGSANRKTEDQELESLAAIEAELEKVAHKLHELRRG